MGAQNLRFNCSLKARTFKCFADAQGFEQILPINVIIGRNNTGKSALLDLVEYAISPTDISSHGHRGTPPEVILTSEYTKSDVPDHNHSVPLSVDQGRHSTQTDARSLCSAVVGKFLDVSVMTTGELTTWKPPDVRWPVAESFQDAADTWFRNQHRPTNPFVKLSLCRLLADRNIRPEGAINADSLAIHSDGSGATQVIQAYLNLESLDRNLVEGDLCRTLNELLGRDGRVDRFVPLSRGANHPWEIYFDEPGKGLVPLSSMGSGIKKNVTKKHEFARQICPHIDLESLQKSSQFVRLPVVVESIRRWNGMEPSNGS